MARTTSGFADGRHEVSPDSEQIEHTETKFLLRNSVSVEQIQDRREEPSRLKTKKEPLKGSFINGGNDEARTRDLMRDRGLKHRKIQCLQLLYPI